MDNNLYHRPNSWGTNFEPPRSASVNPKTKNWLGLNRISTRIVNIDHEVAAGAELCVSLSRDGSTLRLARLDSLPGSK